MELTHRFTVPGSLADAWLALNDLERIAPCFPGAAISSYDGTDFIGSCKVKLGPVSLLYNGSGQFAERDEGAHRAVIMAKGRDRRGNGTAGATITATLAEVDGPRTEVTVVTDLTITGRPAQFGRGVMQDVGDALLGQFASCLETKLAHPAGGEAGAAVSSPETQTDPVAAGVETQPLDAPSPEAGRHRGPARETGDADSPGEAAMSAPETSSEPAALDLGATVLPAILRRYAPYLGAAMLALVVLRRLFRRGSPSAAG